MSYQCIASVSLKKPKSLKFHFLGLYVRYRELYKEEESSLKIKGIAWRIKSLPVEWKLF